MGTKALIQIMTSKQRDNTPEVCLYKHNEGYPSGTLILIASVLSKHKKDYSAEKMASGLVAITKGTELKIEIDEFRDDKNNFDIDWVYKINIKDKTVAFFEKSYRKNVISFNDLEGAQINIPDIPYLHLNAKYRLEDSEKKEIKLPGRHLGLGALELFLKVKEKHPSLKINISTESLNHLNVITKTLRERGVW